MTSYLKLGFEEMISVRIKTEFYYLQLIVIVHSLSCKIDKLNNQALKTALRVGIEINYT